MNEAAIGWLTQPSESPDERFRQAAVERQMQLTKPPGALGRLEELAIQLAALQKTDRPCADIVQIIVFAADHGIAVENVSAFPQSVTGEMIRNFVAGGAAINVLARMINAQLEIVNLGTVSLSDGAASLETCFPVQNIAIGQGTANFLSGEAMDETQLIAALNAGRKSAEHARKNNTHILIGGEMGIGNTTSATALACVLLKLDPAMLTGPGSGLGSHGVTHKANIIERALELHRAHIRSPVDALRCLGGFEIAALTGAYIRSAQLALPVLVDGFISSVAALLAESICRNSKSWFIYAHQSAEPAHVHILGALQASPLLELGMRLGEGSGAAVAVNLLRQACALHNEMATFSSAHVSTRL